MTFSFTLPFDAAFAGGAGAPDLLTPTLIEDGILVLPKIIMAK